MLSRRSKVPSRCGRTLRLILGGTTRTQNGSANGRPAPRSTGANSSLSLSAPGGLLTSNGKPSSPGGWLDASQKAPAMNKPSWACMRSSRCVGSTRKGFRSRSLSLIASSKSPPAGSPTLAQVAPMVIVSWGGDIGHVEGEKGSCRISWSEDGSCRILLRRGFLAGEPQCRHGVRRDVQQPGVGSMVLEIGEQLEIRMKPVGPSPRRQPRASRRIARSRSRTAASAKGLVPFSPMRPRTRLGRRRHRALRAPRHT